MDRAAYLDVPSAEVGFPWVGELVLFSCGWTRNLSEERLAPVEYLSLALVVSSRDKG